jgi:hypothetical protein
MYVTRRQKGTMFVLHPLQARWDISILKLQQLNFSFQLSNNVLTDVNHTFVLQKSFEQIFFARPN